MAVGYLAQLLQAFFGDGQRLGLAIDYSLEDRSLGTVGPLTLIDGLDDAFLMMNGDILTTIDYGELIRNHRISGAVATIATYVRQVKIDFGVLESDAAGKVSQYTEKPVLDYRVSMGIYVFEPRIRAYLERAQYRDFPDLVKALIADGQPVQSYPFHGYWLDMGRPDDYAKAVEEFEARRREFLPDED